LPLSSSAANSNQPRLTAGDQLIYPHSAVKLVVPFPPGGSADIVARVIADPLGDRLGQKFFIENRAGGDGAVAAEHIAHAQADGHELFMATYGAMSALPHLLRHPGYDPLAEFTPVTQTGRFAFFVFVNTDVPAKSIGALIEHARAHPGVLNYGTGNVGSIVATARLAQDTAIQVVRIPYKGEVPAMTDLIEGRIHFMVATPSNAIEWVKRGKLRAVATLLEARSPILPEAPTMKEAGLPSPAMVPWAGVFGPAGLRPEVASRLAAAIGAVLPQPALQQEFSRQAFESAGSASPAGFAAYVRDQYRAWGEAIQAAGIEPE
jgi:tripartite-type tricarboxylate transporter receptor subunit TctC